MIYSKSILGTLLSFIAFLTLLPTTTNAQEQWGLRQSNYAGINSLSLNPANATDLPLNWDLNIVSAGAFVENNYAYVKESNLIHFLRNSSNLALDNPEDPAHSTNSITTYDFYSNPQNDYFAQVSSFVSGPSFLLKRGNSTVGVFVNARSEINTRKVDQQFGYHNYENQEVGASFAAKMPEVKGMNWTEIGLHAGSKLGKNMALAANIKVLQGLDGFYYNSSSPVNLLIQANQLQLSTGEMNYAYAGNIDFENGGYQPKINGWGVGADVGVNFYFGEVLDGPYRLKVGGSLVDVGFVRFNKQAQQHELNNIKAVFENDFLANANNETELAQAVSETITGDETASLQGDQFTLWTPTAFTAQADFAFNDKLYLNATAVRGVAINENTLVRGNTLSVTPRYESRWLEVAVPMTFYGQEDFRVGTAVKLGFITVGTDNLGSIVGKKDFTGTDVYVALKVNPFDMEKSLYNRNGKKQPKSSVDCPKNFNYGKKRKLKL